MVHLDALRAFAILSVMACHLLSYRVAREGARGVSLFFVLSGFLITGILLNCKRYVERDGQPRLYTLRQFYVRRFLRIFPLYYLVVIVLWLLHDTGARMSIYWLLAYAGNVQHAVLYHQHNWPRLSIAHFWTLAVEEQFYLVWPWVIRLSPAPVSVARTVLMPAGV
jgi:peptidoglycan/LPS O-acetylase OafA/YrhL